MVIDTSMFTGNREWLSNLPEIGDSARLRNLLFNLDEIPKQIAQLEKRHSEYALELEILIRSFWTDSEIEGAFKAHM